MVRLLFGSLTPFNITHMKISLYNTFVPYRGNVVVYNSLWDSCIMMGADNPVLSILKSRDGNQLSLLDNNTLNELYNKNFIVRSSEDEQKKVRSILDNTNKSSDYYILTINPTLSCNFNCWYCYENHIEKKRMSKEDVSSVMKLIERILATPSIRKIHLNFFGGEPMLCFTKTIKPIIENTHLLTNTYKKEYSVSLTTNAYFLKKEYSLYFKQHNLYSFQITLDGNRERHNNIRTNKQGIESYDVIVKNIKYALSNECNVIVRINVSEDTGLDVPLLLKDFSDLTPDQRCHMVFSIQKVWQANEDVNATIGKIVDEIRTLGYNCQAFNLSFHNVKSTCYSDKSNHLIINPDGDIFGCTARDFNKETLEGKLHNDGTILYNDRRHKRMGMSPLENLECRNCYILPMCIGGCKQRLMDNDGKKCPYGFSETEKSKFAEHYVIERFR